MRRIALSAAIILAAVTNLWAQAGQVPAWNIWANPSAAASNLRSATLTQMLDGAFCNTSGQILQRGASVWACIGLVGGSSGQVQTNNGSGGLAGITNTALTSLINPATTSLSGALPAWPNDTTKFFRGDGTYQTIGATALPAGVDANVLNTQTANYSVALTDCGKTIQLGTGATGLFILTFPSVAGFAANCSVIVVNGDTARGKAIAGLTGITKLYPGQGFGAKIVNGAWVLFFKPPRWLVPVGSTVTVGFNKDTGNNTGDCLGTGSGACSTLAQAVSDISNNFDIAGTVIIQAGCTSVPCTYADLPFFTIGYVGGGSVVLNGDTTTPANFVMTCTAGCPGGAAINISQASYGTWTIQGFKLTGTAANNGGIQVVYANARVLFQKIEFGAFNNGSAINCIGPNSVNDIPSGNYTISGGGAYFAQAQDACILHLDSAVGTLTGTPNFTTAFLGSHGAGAILGTDNTHFSGAATGQRCNANLLALIDTAGTSASLPGNSACVVGSGGYVN